MKFTTYRLCKSVEYWNWNWWKESLDWAESMGLGNYDPFLNKIKVLQEIKVMKKDDECPDVYKYTANNYWQHILVHEYTHYLQWRKGHWVEPLLLFPQDNLEVPDLVKEVYRKEDWGIETEAFYVEKHPELLDELEAPLINIPERVLSTSEKALRKQGIRPVFAHVKDQYVEDLYARTYYWDSVAGMWFQQK